MYIIILIKKDRVWREEGGIEPTYTVYNSFLLYTLRPSLARASNLTFKRSSWRGGGTVRGPLCDSALCCNAYVSRACNPLPLPPTP
jgi:hypothetical protein